MKQREKPVYGQCISDSGREKPRRAAKIRAVVLLLALVLLIADTVIGTVSFIEKRTLPVVNDFTPAAAPAPVIDEDFADGDTVKSNVRVRLSGGDKSYFVRAAVVISLQDEDGNTVAKVPVEGTDYSIVMGSGWTKNGDYWYCNSATAADSSTPNLIESCTTLNSDYRLVVDVLAQIIQSNPAGSAQTEWGYTPS